MQLINKHINIEYITLNYILLIISKQIRNNITKIFPITLRCKSSLKS